MLAEARALGKPVVVVFLGADPATFAGRSIVGATTLAEAADLGIEKGEVFIAHVCGVGDAARIIAVERITSKAEV